MSFQFEIIDHMEKSGQLNNSIFI